MPRRRPGALLPLEQAILEVAVGRHGTREPRIHGFALARELADGDGARRLVAHGTLYKALDRLEQAGLLRSDWEDSDTADTGRPRRRLYEATGEAAVALRSARRTVAPAPRARPGLVGS